MNGNIMDFTLTKSTYQKIKAHFQSNRIVEILSMEKTFKLRDHQIYFIHAHQQEIEARFESGAKVVRFSELSSVDSIRKEATNA